MKIEIETEELKLMFSAYNENRAHEQDRLKMIMDVLHRSGILHMANKYIDNMKEDRKKYDTKEESQEATH